MGDVDALAEAHPVLEAQPPRQRVELLAGKAAVGPRRHLQLGGDAFARARQQGKGTPFAAKSIGAATAPKLVPYGALTATFHTGLGGLVAPRASTNDDDSRA